MIYRDYGKNPDILGFNQMGVTKSVTPIFILRLSGLKQALGSERFAV